MRARAAAAAALPLSLCAPVLAHLCGYTRISLCEREPFLPRERQSATFDRCCRGPPADGARTFARASGLLSSLALFTLWYRCEREGEGGFARLLMGIVWSGGEERGVGGRRRFCDPEVLWRWGSWMMNGIERCCCCQVYCVGATGFDCN